MSYFDSQIVTGTSSAVANTETTISTISIPAGQQWVLRRMWAAGSNNAVVKIAPSTYPQAYFQYIFNSATAGALGTSFAMTELNVPINGPTSLDVNVIDQNAASAVEIMIQYESTGGPTN